MRLQNWQSLYNVYSLLQNVLLCSQATLENLVRKMYPISTCESDGPSQTSLAQGSLRQTRNQTERLEAELWAWRNKCRESGKKIPKRLVQARAKWAFQKEGIRDFKASE